MPRRASLALALSAFLALALAGCGASPLGDLLSSATNTGGGSGTGSPPAGGLTMSTAEETYAHAVLDIVNQERAQASLAPLQWLDGATAAAYYHSTDMDVRNYFAHTDPDGKGPTERLNDQGVVWTSAGENIARGYPDPKSVMDAWMSSSGHRANILSPWYTHLGVGVHGGGDGPWWTQDFVGQ